jgi:hypothetical protein
MSPGTARVDGVTGSGTASGAQHRGRREDNVVAGSGMASQAWGQRLCGRRRHRLDRGRWWHVKGLDCGQK